MTRNILVTGSSTFFATRLIHELGRKGANVTAADSLFLSAGKMSNYTRRCVRLPMLATHPGKYLDAVLAELQAREYDLLLPTFEEGLLFAEYQDEIRQYTNLYLPPFETMMRLHHKPTLDQVCQQLSIPTPPTYVVENEHELQQLAEELEYPVVLKLPASNNSVGRTFCDNRESLRESFRRLVALQPKHGGELPFVQRKIDGDLVFTLCFCNRGQKLGEVVYQTRRTFPMQGGTAAHRESIEHAEISRYTSRLCAAASWTGFLGLDFIIDRKTKIPYLIDANVRANPAIHLGFLSGIDWSGFLLDLLAGKSPKPAVTRTGINSQTLLLNGGCLVECLGNFSGGPRAWAHRIYKLFRPDWQVDSRDDLFGVGEYTSLLTLGVHAVISQAKSFLTGRQVGQLLLDDVNYDGATVAALRRERVATTPVTQRLSKAA